MILFHFENWVVTENGIEWVGPDKGIEYFISQYGLSEQGKGEWEGKYNWPLHLTEKIWINKLDLQSFNKAFIFACNHFKLELDADALARTIDYQEFLFENRDKDLLPDEINK
jgi:hypothetical protein